MQEAAPSPEPSYTLVVKCPDRRGVVAAVATYLAAAGHSITESSHFNDAAEDLFFMRVAFRPDEADAPSLEILRAGFAPIAGRFAMEWAMHDRRVKPRVLILVSRFGHCLFDLLHRWRAGLLAVDIPAVVSNHEDMRSFVEWSGIPFHHLPVRGAADRPAQEARLLEIVARERIDLTVLARYMQVLSDEASAALAGRCINIHHSFLPSFKGAKPYHQAHARGVKIIGATAHYVTADLDEGPIIEQDVERVTHVHTPETLVQIGRDVECRVLARAVAWHVDHRVMLNGRKVVVFA